MAAEIIFHDPKHSRNQQSNNLQIKYWYNLQLTQPHIQRRSTFQNISYPLQQVMKRFVPESELPEEEKPSGICVVCPRRKNRKTKKSCIYCQKFLCTEHSSTQCDMCKASIYDEDYYLY